jgi:hypothetical protein
MQASALAALDSFTPGLCFICNKPDHRAAVCPARAKLVADAASPKSAKPRKKKQAAKAAQEEVEIAGSSATVLVSSDRAVWLRS